MKLSSETKGQVIPFIQNGEYFFKKGVGAYQKKELNRAVKYLRRAIDINPKEAVFQCQLAAILADLGRYEESNDLLLHVLDHVDSTMYDSYFFLANNYAYQGLFEKAKEAATNYLQYCSEGDFAEDARDLLELLKLDNDQGESQERDGIEDELILSYEKACRYMKDGHYNKAEELLENIITDYPSFRSAYSQLAYVLHLKGYSEEALAFTKDLLEEEQYLPAICQLALLYYDMGRKEESKEVADLLKQVVPMDRDHIYRLGATFCHLAEYEEGYRWFKHLGKRFAPDHEDYFFKYGVTAYQIGKESLAKKMWEQADHMGHQAAADLLEKMKDGILSKGDARCDLYMDPGISLR
ncbi:tetratricopeptide repeat protein [Bacillus sp. FJAT-44742]|uniref:tetratricopeptide repeat protein n=1 Tax=Bacillus sp. FJAT-44742 TaxID=2014005 RepID=UPI000C249FB4|nr:tetratricopeptide repeat protein [Bacillus sp. FJAT-44742]